LKKLEEAYLRLIMEPWRLVGCLEPPEREEERESEGRREQEGKKSMYSISNALLLIKV